MKKSKWFCMILQWFYKEPLLIMSVAFTVPSKYSFKKLQLHVIKRFQIIFTALHFYFHQLKKRVLDFLIYISN